MRIVFFLTRRTWLKDCGNWLVIPGIGLADYHQVERNSLIEGAILRTFTLRGFFKRHTKRAPLDSRRESVQRLSDTALLAKMA
jgi:hypothetical protein